MTPVSSALCYVRPHHEAFFRRLCGDIFGEARTTFVSDFRDVGTVQVNERFYKRLRSGPLQLPPFLSEGMADDMAMRCRYLRKLPTARQRQLLAAMAGAMDEVLDDVRPDVVVSLTVDCYVVDVLHLCSQARGVPFLGLVPTMINGYFMLTARGERNAFRLAGDDECARVLDLIRSPEYRPAYQPSNASSALSVARRYARETAKALYFPIRRIVSRDPYNLYYAGSAAMARQCIALGNFFPGRFYDDGWSAQIARDRPVLYLPLQYTPECNADYWCQHRDFLLYDEGVLKVVDRVAAGANVLVKEHPSMVGYRPVSFYRALLRNPGVVLVPPAVGSLDVMTASDAVLSWSGSAGIEAVLLRDTPVVDFGEPYYASGRLTRTVRSEGELLAIDDVLSALGAEAPLTRAEKLDYVRNILGGCLPGGLAHIRAFDPDDSTAAAEMAAVVESLAANIDDWFAWAKGDARADRETVA